MSLIETIKKRKSTRTFRREPLRKEDLVKIREFIRGLTPPFGARVRIELLETKGEGEPRRLGTYGVIRGATAFLVLAYHPAPMAEEAAGYVFEQVVLYCTELGLGTCWLGGTFKQEDFAREIRMEEGETLRIVSPVGYKAERKTLVDITFGALTKHNERQPFETRFFVQEWSQPLLPEKAGKYIVPLEMVRLAPSASNKQPWRVLVCGDTLHFFAVPKASPFTAIDLGIAMAHFELTCRELGLKGAFESMETEVPMPDTTWKYVASWKAL